VTSLVEKPYTYDQIKNPTALIVNLRIGLECHKWAFIVGYVKS